MLERYVLVYVFLCFSIGLACLGVTLVLARRKDNHLARAFLGFYATLSLLVFSSLLLAFADAVPGEIGPSTRFVLEYVVSIVGFYGIMFMLPFFFHRIFGVVSPARDRILLLVVLLAALGQHITEFGLDDEWDQRGDMLENGLFVAVLVYTGVVAFSRFRSEGTDRRLAKRVLAIGLVCSPAVLYDLFLADSTGLPFYPFLYCLFSVVVTWTLTHETSAVRRRSPESDHGLSARETEVLELVRRGLSNKDIGEDLHISPNTVKTHLRAIFDKMGVRSRFELIARTNEPAEDLLQIEDETRP